MTTTTDAVLDCIVILTAGLVMAADLFKFKRGTFMFQHKFVYVLVKYIYVLALTLINIGNNAQMSNKYEICGCK